MNNQTDWNIVLFKDACEHTIRITRLISLQNGHLLLVGDSSSGKRTLSMLAAKIMNVDFQLIQITGRYKQKDFRSELFETMMSTVMADKPLLCVIYDHE